MTTCSLLFADEQIADDAGVFDARNRPELFERAAIQVTPLRVGVEDRRAESCITSIALEP